MSRKPSRPERKPLSTAAGIDEQEGLALVHLEKGRYRDAVDGFKSLLKEELRPEWLAAPLRAVADSGAEWLRRWIVLNSSQQAIALDLLGCPQALAPLLRALAGAAEDPAPVALFDLVQRHSRDLPNSVATRMWRWLAPWAVRRGCASPRIFGGPSPADEECATALAQEIGGDSSHAETHRTDAAELIAARGEADDRLRAALILRRCALSAENLSRDDVLSDAGAAPLTKSLEFDVYDRDTHIHLVRFWRRKDNLKKARARLDFGLVYFPDDIGLLAEAVETALAAGAFKKAAPAARRLLELDPLNRKVRSLVGNAHLSHAGKQISAGRAEAAKTEIEEAATWLDAAAERGRMTLLQAWTEKQGSSERLRLAGQATSTWGGGLAAGCRAGARRDDHRRDMRGIQSTWRT